MRYRTRPLVSAALGMLLAASPGLAPAEPQRPPGESWFDWAGKRADEAAALEGQGRHGEAEQLRVEVLEGLVRAWREEQDPRALDPIVKTLHTRLKRSTSAVRVALRFMYELRQAEQLDPAAAAQFERLEERVAEALLRLRREASPGDAAVCRGPIGLRLGELALEGPLPGDPILVLRDVEGGKLEAVTCPVLAEPLPAVEQGNEPWWLMGGGLAVVALGGVLMGLSADWQSRHEELEAAYDPPAADLSMDETIELHRAGGRSEAYFNSAIFTLSLGGAMAVGGLVWGLARGDGEAPSGAALGPAPNGLVVFGRF